MKTPCGQTAFSQNMLCPIFPVLRDTLFIISVISKISSTRMILCVLTLKPCSVNNNKRQHSDHMLIIFILYDGVMDTQINVHTNPGTY